MARTPKAPKSAKSPLDAVPTNAARGRPTVKGLTAKRSSEDARRPIQVEEARTYLDTGSAASAALVDANKPLTTKQKDFIRHWAQGESILSASHRAGYSDGGTYAYRMVRMPNVLALYNAEKKLYEEACGMTRKKVMDGLLEAVEMAKLVSEPSSMIQGWKTIGQMCGYFEPVKKKVEISITGNVMIDRLNTMSDAELLQAIAGEVLIDGDDE